MKPAIRTFDLPAYLARISYAGPLEPTPEVLRQVHRAHLLNVPFENLDISHGREIVVDQEASLRKIVQERRGGFCYEMNGAFAALLQAIGFPVTLLSAQVARSAGVFGPDFDHLTLRVDLDEPWLADVGFGDSFLEPLRLQTGLEQPDHGSVYRIAELPECLALQRREADGPWTDRYRFTLQPRRLEEFAAMCRYHQTSPDSGFTRKRLCTRATLEGRVTLSDMKLTVTRHGQKEERMLSSEEEWRANLRQQFGVVLD